MRRLPTIALMVFVVCSTGFGAPDEGASPAPVTPAAPAASVQPAGVVQLAEVRAGMRLRVQLAGGRAFVGTVSAVTGAMIELDLSTEESGLPGKVRIRRTDIAQAGVLAAQTEDDRRRVLEEREGKIAGIRIETRARSEERRAGEQKEGEEKKSAKEMLRKALDVMVAREEEDEMRALLAEFQPDEWGEERLRQVRENWILRDLMPSEKESRFTSLFERWKNARDVVAILDQRKAQAEGEKLLLRFPPSQGWGYDRLTSILEKQAKGEPVAEQEDNFRKSYEAWSQAVLERGESLRTPPAGETPTQPAATEEQPTEEKPVPAETPADQASPASEPSAGEQKPAEQEKPADEKQTPVPGTPAQEQDPPAQQTPPE